MNRCFFLFLAIVLCSFTTKQEQMLADIDSIGSTFIVHYAPIEWKKKFSGWDLREQLELAKEQVSSSKNLSVRDYQKIIRRFFRGTQDYHCSVRFHSTELALLPFTLIPAEDRYFVMDSYSNAIRDGDELLMMNGKKIHELVLEIQREEFGTEDSATDRLLAAGLVTRRMASMGTDVPRGRATLTVQPKHAKQPKKCQVQWYYRPEKIKHRSLVPLAPTDDSSRHKMLTPLYFDVATNQTEVSRHTLGDRRGFLPSLGHKVWEAEGSGPFRAYIFELDNHKVGYIRIPHYLGGAEEVKAFSQIIATMETEAEALVIDQLNNPGGNVFYLYALASLLTDKPLDTPKHRLTLTPREVEFAVNAIPSLEQVKNIYQARIKLGNTVGGYPVTLETAQNMLQFCRFVVAEWNEGKSLSHPIHLYGVDKIRPHPSGPFTKPILLLINERDFSGGDFMPAILQDNARAVLFGERTAGAGGFVARVSFPNRFGIDYFHYTASIAERSDTNPIENLGVTPDIRYSLTPADLQEGYQNYRAEVLRAVQVLLQ